MRIGGMCSGYAGLEAAVREVFGGEVVWHADNDPRAVAVLEHHFPDVPNHGDITATEPGTRGNRRLSPAFAEWMMGLPEGWVTQVPGLSRNDQIHRIGEGVVPRQAVRALEIPLPELSALPACEEERDAS